MLAKRLYAGNIRPEVLARFAVVVNILLVIVLAHAMARLSWNLIASPAFTIPGVDDAELNIGAAQESRRIDYAAIADWHLFGQLNEAQPVAVAHAPETTLNLKLVGIFHAEQGGKTLAIIAEGGGEEQVYMIGDQLSASVRVEQIHRHQVVLSRNGRLETLSLPSASQGVTETAPSRVVPASTAGEIMTVDASDIAKRVRTALKIQPQALQDLALARPYIQNGRFKGFRIQPGKKRELLGQLGLRNDDVIVEVDGTPLDSPAQAMALLEGALNSNRFQALVLRDGAAIPFVFSVNGQ